MSAEDAHRDPGIGGSGERAFPLRVRVAAIAIGLLASALLLEVGSAVVWYNRHRLAPLIRRDAHASLNPYQMPDPVHPGNWVLRPGFSQTLDEAIRTKEAGGRELGADYLRARATELGYATGDTLFHVNEAGYKGPPLRSGDDHVRIVAIGNSCTFGSLFDRWAYPRALERTLAQAGLDAEVVNAGVEGYAPRNVLARIDELRSLGADLAVLYLGWNALFTELEVTPPGRRVARFYTIRLARRALDNLRVARQGATRVADTEYARPLTPDPSAPEVDAMARWAPGFLDQVEAIADSLETAGTRVVLTTLPGLFVTDEAPSTRALEVGHLPRGVVNPYVLAKAAERYNDALRAMAQRNSLLLVDLARWSRDALQPLDAHFFDSIHLYEESQALIGSELARQLESTVRRLETRSTTPAAGVGSMRDSG